MKFKTCFGNVILDTNLERKFRSTFCVRVLTTNLHYRLLDFLVIDICIYTYMYVYMYIDVTYMYIGLFCNVYIHTHVYVCVIAIW